MVLNMVKYMVVYSEDEWLTIYVCEQCKFHTQFFTTQCFKCGCAILNKMRIKIRKQSKNVNEVND